MWNKMFVRCENYNNVNKLTIIQSKNSIYLDIFTKCIIHKILRNSQQQIRFTELSASDT